MNIKQWIFAKFFPKKNLVLTRLYGVNKALSEELAELKKEVNNYSNYVPDVTYKEFLEKFLKLNRMPTKEEKQVYNDKYFPCGWVLALNMRKVGQLPPTKCAQFITAFKEFDFTKVHEYMTEVNWTWSNTEYGRDLVPTLYDLYRCVFSLASRGESCSSGGFTVSFEEKRCVITFEFNKLFYY